MAGILRGCLTRLVRYEGSFLTKQVEIYAGQRTSLIPQHQPGILVGVRCLNILVRTTADSLWKGVTSVSNAGRKRGRARGLRRKIDLNRGQRVGVGKEAMRWPGLNAPILKGKELVTQKKLEPDEVSQALVDLKVRSKKRMKLHPLDRGWSGRKLGGRHFGPPDPIGEDKFEGFDSIILESRVVQHTSGKFGKVRTQRCLAAVGNGNGLIGFDMGRAKEARAAVRRAKNRAAQRLIRVERYEDHTIFHDFCSTYGKTRVFAHSKPHGYGYNCHRAIKAICQLVGIKDLDAKVEGPANTYHITKAFILGLINQKTFQQIADEKKLHIVKLSKETDYFPEVVASPEVCRKSSDITSDEELNFKLYISNGKVEVKRKKFVPFYVGDNFGWNQHLKKTWHRRNWTEVKVNCIARYGKLTSHVHENEQMGLEKDGVSAYPGRKTLIKYKREV